VLTGDDSLQYNSSEWGVSTSEVGEGIDMRVAVAVRLAVASRLVAAARLVAVGRVTK